MFRFARNLKRRRLAKRAFPESWLPIVEARLPFAARLAGDEREPYLTHLKVFAWMVSWEGAGGLEVTDEMRVVVSGAAARMARRLPLDVYDGLRSIVIYPSNYRHPEGDDIILGEASSWGVVVLSWDAVEHGICNPFDGHDTALHELAHVLDMADGVFDGTPLLPDAHPYQSWVKVFSSHYLRMKRRPNRSVLRSYGATNEAEFFAVATETFFEKSKQLKRRAPDLYDELARYYRVDPASD